MEVFAVDGKYHKKKHLRAELYCLSGKHFLLSFPMRLHNRYKSEVEIVINVKHPYTLSLAIGIGTVAGLRPMTAPAIIAWAAKRRWIHLGSSPFAAIISAKASRTITELAISERLRTSCRSPLAD